MRPGDVDQFAQKGGKFSLLRFIQGGEELRDVFLEKGDGAFIEFDPLSCQRDTNYPPVVGVSLTNDQSFFLQSVYYAGKVADGDHHLFTDLTEGKSPCVTDGRQDVELGRREIQLLQTILEPLVGIKIKAQEANP